MFAYAYGQIEKERAFGLKGQSPSVQDLEPSLLPPKTTTAATSSEQQQYYDDDAMVVVEKKRFKISLSFIDLSLVLKGSGKKILSNVTGKLAPGCITAVMGPSGAGKTMFLNALAGKSASFSHTTGQVLINGHPGSIHCYKRIIGFVPQDDVVHGSLTVEENLWFSASYRSTSASLCVCLSLALSSFVKIL
jgi:ABC-type bacteriocin/lantibiotic exporter with double-glycine peptidase domain